MFFAIILLALSAVFGSDEAFATETVQEPVTAVSIVTVSDDDGITAYVG